MYVDELLAARTIFGDVFVQIYGQGEAPMTITALSRHDHESTDRNVLGSVGWPRSGIEVRIHNGGRDAAVGEIGEVICRGDVVMQGYWNNPAATAEAVQDGWLHTGDLGVLDASGRLTLYDRLKDFIISGGSNIYSREVEDVLLAHPDLREAAVIGVPDPDWGERVVAFVVAAAGTDVSAAILDAHCLARMARYKRPKRYIFIDGLPKNNYGKVVKRYLREAPFAEVLSLPTGTASDKLPG